MGKLDTNKFWDAVKAELNAQLSELNYNTWIRNTYAENLTEDSIDIICQHKHHSDILKKQYLSLIRLLDHI